MYLVAAACAGLGVLGLWTLRARAPESSPAASTPTGSSPSDSSAADAPYFSGGGAGETSRKAWEAFRAGDFQTALAHYEELARISPANAATHLYVGLCRQRLGDAEGAVASLRRAVELQPGNREARDVLVRLLKETGNLTEAEELQKGLVANGRDGRALIEMARIHREQGKLDDAIAALRQAVDLEPSNREAQLELGLALNHAKRGAEAVEVFRQLAAAKPDDPVIASGLGAALLLAGGYKEAVGPLEQATRLKPDDPRSRLNLALAYEKLDRIEDSLREYEAFVKLAPDDPLAAKIDDLVKKARAALAEEKRKKS